MAPAHSETPNILESHVETTKALSKSLQRKSLQSNGLINDYKWFDVTPVIGREYPTAKLKEWLHAPNSDELLRELAITSEYLRVSMPCPQCIISLMKHVLVSQRGVVFFRQQDDLDNELQKELAQRLGHLSGKPNTSTLHIHPVSNSGRELGGKDDKISVISSEQGKKLYKARWSKRQSQKGAWHSDITFEPVPSDYAILRLTQLPETGGGMHESVFSWIFDRF